MTREACPEFPEATRRFGELLRREGWPGAIRWVRGNDAERVSATEIVVYLQGDDDGAADAAALFDRGRSAGLGVHLSAVCTWGDVTCATVSSPADAREAAELLVPEDGLKLSVAVPRLAGTVRWAFC